MIAYIRLESQGRQEERSLLSDHLGRVRLLLWYSSSALLDLLSTRFSERQEVWLWFLDRLVMNKCVA